MVIWSQWRFLPLLLLCLCGSSLFLAGCNEQPDCIQKGTNTITLGFYDAEGEPGGLDDIVKISALDAPIALYERGEEISSVSKILFPLNPHEKSTTIIFQRENTSDTLKLAYDLKYKVISPECGAEAVLSNITIQQTTFETIEFTPPNLQQQNEDNIKVYL